MNWAKKNWILLAAVVALVLFWFMRRKSQTPSVLSPDANGFPNAERASAHFTWQELQEAAPGGAKAYADLTEFQKNFLVSLARAGELVRSKLGDLPIILHTGTLPTDETDDYVALFKPTVSTKEALAQSVQDVSGLFASYASAFTYKPELSASIGSAVTGNTGDLIDAVAKGAA